MKRSFLLLFPVIFLITTFSTGSSAAAPGPVDFFSVVLERTSGKPLVVLLKDNLPNRLLAKALKKSAKNEKLTAVALAIALGPFGVHRLYLGTGPVVPVVYTLTLGGGLGVLPIADIIAILAAKDLEPYRNNNKVVMWVD